MLSFYEYCISMQIALEVGVIVLESFHLSSYVAQGKVSGFPRVEYKVLAKMFPCSPFGLELRSSALQGAKAGGNTT